MKKLILTLSFVAFMGAFFVTSEVDPRCGDPTYPSKYCDPQGFDSCTRICNDPVVE